MSGLNVMKCYITLTVLYGLMYAVRAQCPDRCQCYGTTVRCMFLQLETIPAVPRTTTILDLRFNVIKDIPRGAFRNIPRLDTLLLNNNELEVVKSNAFEGLRELRYLYLYKNKIEEIEPDVFKHLHKLEQLFLHGNDLKRLPPGLFSSNKKLKRLRLDSNALICDCEMVWLAQMLKENLADTQAAATCDHPGNLRGKSLMEINMSEFNCEKPVITSEPSDVEISFGNTAYFRCRAEGSPTPEIVWVKNNEIVDTTERRYNILEDGTLMIEDARDTDEGTYECIARNTAGEVKTDGVELRMNEQHHHHHHNHNRQQQNQNQRRQLDNQIERHPGRHDQPRYNVAPTFLSRPSDVHADLGDTIDLPCSATGYPQPEIAWTLNGNAIRLNSRISIVGGGLHIISVRDDDRGDYRCRAENSEGIITATARLVVQVAPHFVLRPVDIILPEDSTAVFQCDAMGEPTPLISWYRNNDPLPNNGRFQILDSGRTLRITRIETSDRDVYVCRAESAAGRMEAQAELQVSSKTAPNFNRREVEEKYVEEGADVNLDCSADGQPSPQFRWIKDGTTLRNGRKYLVEGSVLTIRRAINSDEGLYECFAENTLGFARHSVKLIVRDAVVRPGDRFVTEAISSATSRVENAINITRSELFDRGKTHNVEDLLSLFRYPSAETLEIARAEEIFEQTLEIIHRHVAEGHNYDLEGNELSYQEIVSPAHLSLIANMSGCFRRNLPQKCTNMCFHKKYRTLDGTCNNLQNPSWGSANSALQRLLPAQYENGFNSPIGWNKARLYNGKHVPSPRLISSVMMTADSVSTDSKDTHMVMQWGQFIDHDIDLTPQSVSQHIFNDGRRCNETCENSFPCFPIPVPSSDQRVRGQSCLGFHRSSATCNTGTTSIFFKTFSHRQQLNALTSYIDGSQVYGSSDSLAERLRDVSHEHGHLLVGSLYDSGKRQLPYDFHGIIGPADCQIESSKRYIPCFLTGDSRANEHLGLTAMHTLWMREHNRIASELLDINPHWDGNMLYHEARKIVGAMMQHITYTGWLPKIIGPEGMRMIGEYKGYNPAVDASVTNEFATAAMRFGHSLVQPVLFRLNSSFQPIREGNLPLHKAFFSPYRVVEEGGIDPILRGLFAQGAKLRMPNEIMNSELTERLFSLANRIGQDLAALNIQRGRDHGLPFYNEYRKMINLTEARNFNDLRNEIQDRNTRESLELLYGHVDNIDLFVGGMAETPLEGAKVGPTFTHILADQFKRLRDGDRFWYENPMVFSPDQLVQLKQFSLARVICDSSDSITHAQRDVFTMVQSRDDYIMCSDIPKIDLKMWSDCCMDCGKAGDFRSITSHFRRRRAPEFSYQSDSSSGGEALEMLENLRGQMYNRQEIDLKMHHMENRLKDMQGIMQAMDHSMKKMKRNMRTMMSHTTKDIMCMDDDGQKHPHGDKWNKDDCTRCKCRMGKIRCKTTPCPSPNCAFPKKMPGQCCMVC
ncbi:peroxidasin-like isoform X2 [Mercenaria mercenaria]|uniref:peroxidasin-like isoform X2 n=1 Tax=Mercenaria mercenaria TaxID=6596 RepID=UPI00234F9BB2|nr:peroxidasin-like isoform X2 [Mercenaria mercenaria]